jgi:hypothetical protein
LGRTPRQVRRTYFAIAERLDETPAPDGRTGALFRAFAIAFAFAFAEEPLTIEVRRSGGTVTRRCPEEGEVRSSEPGPAPVRSLA